jgi:fatty-acyl-CoA synthase
LTFTTSGTTSGPKLLRDQQNIAGMPPLLLHHSDVTMRRFMVLPCGTGNAAAAAVAGGAHIVCLAQRRCGSCFNSATHLPSISGTISAARRHQRWTTVDSVRFSGFAAFHSSAAASIAAAEYRLQPRGLYGNSEVQALFSSRAEKIGCAAAVPVSQYCLPSMIRHRHALPARRGSCGSAHHRAPSS